jgi:hypothetical protein
VITLRNEWAGLGFIGSLGNRGQPIDAACSPVRISVRNSAWPAAPKPLDIVPAFGWETAPEGTWNISRRRGGSLCVYLDWPRFSSGEAELLTAVPLGCALATRFPAS